MGASLLRPHPAAVKTGSVPSEVKVASEIVRYAVGKEMLFGNKPTPRSILLHHEYIMMEVSGAPSKYCRVEFGHQSAIWFTFLDEIEEGARLEWREPRRTRHLSDLPTFQGQCAPFTNNCQNFRCRIVSFLESFEDDPPVLCCYLSRRRNRAKAPSEPEDRLMP